MRSFRVAVVSDAVLNGQKDVLAGLAAEGWGVVQLPPAALGPADAEAWMAAVVDQVAELRANGYELVVVTDGGDPWAAASALEGLPRRSP